MLRRTTALAKAKDIIELWGELDPKGGHITVSADDIFTVVTEFKRLHGIIKGQIIENNTLARDLKKAQGK